MATWANWRNEFLNHAGILVTPPNRTFLGDWANHATTNCPNNPIDLALTVGGSTNCHKLPGILLQAQHYTTHAHAAEAFKREVNLQAFKAILGALNSGNPYQVTNYQDVASALVSWGSDKFATFYLNKATGGPPGGGGGASTKAPRTHTGWTHLRHVTNREIAPSLHKSTKYTRAALRALGRTRKVHG